MNHQNQKRSDCREDVLLCTLDNIRAATNGLHHIVMTTKQGVKHSIKAAERAELDKVKAKKEEKKERFRIAYRERNAGKTYKELGVILKVTAGRAMNIFNQARRLNDAGRLFPTKS